MRAALVLSNADIAHRLAAGACQAKHHAPVVAAMPGQILSSHHCPWAPGGSSRSSTWDAVPTCAAHTCTQVAPAYIAGSLALADARLWGGRRRSQVLGPRHDAPLCCYTHAGRGAINPSTVRHESMISEGVCCMRRRASPYAALGRARASCRFRSGRGQRAGAAMNPNRAAEATNWPALLVCASSRVPLSTRRGVARGAMRHRGAAYACARWDSRSNTCSSMHRAAQVGSW
jgi:hypothetical protein